MIIKKSIKPFSNFFVIMAMHEQNIIKSMPNLPYEVSKIDLNIRQISIMLDAKA